MPWACDGLDERMQPLRPLALVDVPVTQARRVVATVPEPSVVEDEELDTDARRRLDQLAESPEVLVEVDGLPRVEQQPSRAVGTGVARSGALPGVEDPADAVDAVVAVGGEDPGRRVRPSGLEPELTGLELLPTEQDGAALRGPVHDQLVVAAPRDVHRPDLTAAEAEAGLPDEDADRGVEPRPSAPGRPGPGADLDRVPLRVPLAAVMTGEVQDLGRDGREREGDVQAVDDVRPLAVLVTACRIRSIPLGCSSISVVSSRPCSGALARTTTPDSADLRDLDGPEDGRRVLPVRGDPAAPAGRRTRALPEAGA